MKCHWWASLAFKPFNGSSARTFFLGEERERPSKVSPCRLTKKHSHTANPAWRWSASTSQLRGVSPSDPCAHPHLNLQACSALFCSLRQLNVHVSANHLPPRRARLRPGGALRKGGPGEGRRVREGGGFGRGGFGRAPRSWTNRHTHSRHTQQTHTAQNRQHKIDDLGQLAQVEFAKVVQKKWTAKLAQVELA